MKAYWVVIFVFGFMGEARAAQLGRIIVNDAPVLETPQKTAKVIAKVKKGTVYQVSNLPTEGFYKTRIASGEYGWISGNDILVTPSSESGARSMEAQPAAASSEPVSEKIEDFSGAKSRIQFAYGYHDALFRGLSDHYLNSDQMNFGTNFTLEFQRKWFYLLYWAVRGEIMKADSGDQSISPTLTQRMTFYSLPVQVGVLFHPVHTQRLRLGVGVYIGASVVTYTNIDQTVSSVKTSVKYNSVDPVATGTLQATWGFGRLLGIFAEFGIRYQQTGQMAAANPPSGAVPGFSINYSAYILKAGAEMRF